MTHPRKVIRSSVVDHIKAADTAAGTRVYAGQQPPIKVEKVIVDKGPVILVYTRRDRADERDYPATGFGSVRRRCDLMVEILAAGNHAVDDKVDDLAEVIEALLTDFIPPGQSATEIRLTETNVDVTEIGEQVIGGAFLLYDVCYWQAWRAEPEVPEFFPHAVSVSPRGGATEPVADCDDCEECPDAVPQYPTQALPTLGGLLAGLL